MDLHLFWCFFQSGFGETCFAEHFAVIRIFSDILSVRRKLVYVSDAQKFECKHICKLGSQSCKGLGIEQKSKCFKGMVALEIDTK